MANYHVQTKCNCMRCASSGGQVKKRWEEVPCRKMLYNVRLEGWRTRLQLVLFVSGSQVQISKYPLTLHSSRSFFAE